MVDLLTAARTAASLGRFVEEDLVGLMVRLDLDAAGSALSGLSSARDRRAVYWSAVNHLESAEAKLRSRIRTSQALEAAQGFFYVSAIKALVLRYLDEPGLVEKCLADSLAVAELYRRWHGSLAGWFKNFIAPYNPAAWAAMLRGSDLRSAAQDFRPAAFWEALGFPGPHSFSLPYTVQESRVEYRTHYWPPG